MARLELGRGVGFGCSVAIERGHINIRCGRKRMGGLLNLRISALARSYGTG